MIKVKVIDHPHQLARFNINGEQITIILKYNFRCDRWFFDLLDSNEQPLIQGKKIVTGTNLLQPVPGLSARLGTFFAYARVAQVVTRDSLHTEEVSLYFANASDFVDG